MLNEKGQDENKELILELSLKSAKDRIKHYWDNRTHTQSLVLMLYHVK
jgi:hypothetical protein